MSPMLATEVSPTSQWLVLRVVSLSAGELFNRIVDQGPFPEADAAALFAQILLSMEYLHSLSIVHRDVKPENSASLAPRMPSASPAAILSWSVASSSAGSICVPCGRVLSLSLSRARALLPLLSPPARTVLYLSEGANSIKLIDFGYAGVWAAEKPLTGLCGTPDYVAPEVLTWYEDDENGTPYGKGSDLWSLGVLLYVILSGCSPFSADEEDAILALVAQAKFEFHEAEWSHISDDAKNLISKLLVVEPTARLSMEQLLDHPWLKNAVAAARADVENARTAKPPASSAPSSSSASSAKPASDAAAAAVSTADGELPTVVQADTRKKGAAACCLIS